MITIRLTKPQAEVVYLFIVEDDYEGLPFTLNGLDLSFRPEQRDEVHALLADVGNDLYDDRDDQAAARVVQRVASMVIRA